MASDIENGVCVSDMLPLKLFAVLINKQLKMFQNVITQSEREQMEGVTNVLAWKGDDANQEGNTLQELQVMPESSSSVFPHGVEDSSCFSSSRDYKVS
jgi:hypothetical protein